MVSCHRETCTTNQKQQFLHTLYILALYASVILTCSWRLASNRNHGAVVQLALDVSDGLLLSRHHQLHMLNHYIGSVDEALQEKGLLVQQKLVSL